MTNHTKTKPTEFSFSSVLVAAGEQSDGLAPGWRHRGQSVVGSQRDPTVSERPSRRCRQ